MLDKFVMPITRRKLRMATAAGALSLVALGFSLDAGFAQVTVTNAGANGSNFNGGSGSPNQNTNNSTAGVSSSGNSLNLNKNTAVGGGNAQQKQQQGISQSGNTTTSINSNAPTPVPNVFAPGLAAAGSEVCLGSVSGGGSGGGFGVMLGGTFVDRECQLRLNARTLATLGYPVAARETMCLDEDVRRAMYAAGTPCAADRHGWGGYGYHASAEPSTQVAAAPATQSVAASQSVASSPRGYASHAPASESVAASPPSSASDEPPSSASDDPNCLPRYQLIGGWYNPCPEKVAEATPATTVETPSPTAKPAKKHTAKAKQPVHAVEVTPTTTSTKVATGDHN
jgi:hypothetical protein